MPRAKRVCRTPGCAEVTDSTFCAEHALENARNQKSRRGTTTQQGYGWNYQKERKRALANQSYCAVCGEPFTTSNPATGGHRRALRNGGTTSDGIEAQCRRCNYGWRRTGL